MLFGTDGSQSRGADEFWRPHWRALETLDEYFPHPAQVRTPLGSPGHGRWQHLGPRSARCRAAQDLLPERAAAPAADEGVDREADRRTRAVQPMSGYGRSGAAVRAGVCRAQRRRVGCWRRAAVVRRCACARWRAADATPKRPRAAGTTQRPKQGRRRRRRSGRCTGCDTAETHYSPLTQITEANVARLGLVWAADLDAFPGADPGHAAGRRRHHLRHRAVERRGGSGRTHRQGEVALGSADPASDVQDRRARACARASARACAAARSIAAWPITTARCSSARSTAASWRSTRRTVAPCGARRSRARPTTTASPARRASSRARSSSAAAASEFGVRGFVAAYDAQTGKQAWRFWTVPGDPSLGFENAAMERAAKTWNGAVVEVRRRRHALGRHGLRPGARSALHRHRQRLAVVARSAQPRRRRQPVSLLDRRASGRTPASTSGTTRRRPADNWDYSAHAADRAGRPDASTAACARC